MTNNMNKFKDGVLGFFNNPSDPTNILYFVGFIFSIILTGILVNFVWQFFNKKDLNSSTKIVNMRDNNKNNNINQ